MNPLVQAMNVHRNSTSPDSSKSRVLNMIKAMTPEQKAKLNSYMPMIQSLARRFGVSNDSFRQCLDEIRMNGM